MKYIGNELEIFSHATNWKNYYSSQLTFYIKGNVLEVGAGSGNNSALLINKNVSSWLCLEPDNNLINLAKEKINDHRFSFLTGKTSDLSLSQNKFDTILYIDVLEHIENDQAELNMIKQLLAKDGYLIVLSPAHNFLFSPFDKAIGHFRRYNKKSLRGLVSDELAVKKCFYLDSIGFFLSLANKLFLKQSMPKISQILFWDRIIIPISRIIDRFTFYTFGKTVVMIWYK